MATFGGVRVLNRDDTSALAPGMPCDLIGVPLGAALALWHRHRNHFGIEMAFAPCRRRALMAAHGPTVGLFARDAVFTHQGFYRR